MELNVRAFSEPKAESDGYRVLVAPCLPNGAAANDPAVDQVADALAPSEVLATWFNEEPEKWLVFCANFFYELNRREAAADAAAALRQHEIVTLLHLEADAKYSSAQALSQFFEHL